MKNTFANQVSNQRHWLVLPKLSVAPVIALLLIMAAVLPGTIAAQSLSNDATLSALTVSPKNIIGFEAERTAYDVGVASTVTQATVTATANDSGASVSITPEDAVGDVSGHQVALSAGRNEVEITVTAEDDNNTETYTVSINRGVTDTFGWKATDDLDGLIAAGNTDPVAVWSDDTTIWVADSDATQIFAYRKSNLSRDSAKDFTDLVISAIDPAGIWSDGITMWVADSSNERIRAYSMATKARDSDKDFNSLDSENTALSGIWSDGITMWVSDVNDEKLYAYDLASKARDSVKDFDTLSAAGNNFPHNMWSDGITMWVADSRGDKLYAYYRSTKQRDPDKDFDTLAAAGNNFPAGIWSDGTTMWVTDGSDGKLYSYNMPRSNDTTIRILIDGREFILPHPRINAYDPPVNTASLTLDISAIQKSARITRITPADADRNTPGHQISVDTSPLVYDNTLVEVEVTAQDGTKRSTDLLIRGFSCHDDLGLGRVAPLRGACIILDLISVKVPYSHTMEYAEEQLNRRSGWTVTWRAESIRWLFATRNPDNLSLQQLQQEASGIKAQPWASLVELQSTAQHDDDGIGDPGDAGTGDQTTEPLTGDFDSSTVPSSHDGSQSFSLQAYFSEEPALGFRNVRDHVLAVTGGDVTAVRRTDPQGRHPNKRWEITVVPDDDDDVTITLPPTTDCDASSAVCTTDGKMLSNGSSITIAGPTPSVPTPTPVATPTPTPIAPPAPTDLSVTLNTDGSVALSWSAPSDDSITGYQILRRRPQMGENTLLVYVNDTGSTSTTHTDTSTSNNTRYVYRVKARNSAGVGPWSNFARLDK